MQRMVRPQIPDNRVALVTSSQSGIVNIILSRQKRVIMVTQGSKISVYYGAECDHLGFSTWIGIWTLNPARNWTIWVRSLCKVPSWCKWSVLAVLPNLTLWIQHLLNHLVCSPEHVRYRIRPYNWLCFDWGDILWRKAGILFTSAEREANYVSTKDSKRRQILWAVRK